jgi:integrase/recombinase XerD
MLQSENDRDAACSISVTFLIRRFTMTHLRQRMIEDMGIRNLADNTQSAYLQQIIAYAEHFHRSPEDLGPEAVRAYQLYLTNTRGLSPSSISVATGALRFLYKVTLKRDWAIDEIPMPKRPFKLPVILSREEVMRFLDSVDSLKHRTILMTAYAAGLRVSEAIHLKVTDIDSRRMTLRVDQGKGRKDRYVMLSPRLLEVLRALLENHTPGAVAIPGRPDRSTHHPGGRRRIGLSESPQCLRNCKAHYPALASSRVRHAPAGIRHR